MGNLMQVIIKDGKRTVNWELPSETTLAELFKRWEMDYYPWESFTITHMEEAKMVLEVKTAFPKKKKKEESN
ncbi:MAG: hypothetical protein J6S14_02395 [Clostridia bacterium]|nr:hypothetical protein [Clostridia bacterium]